MKFNNFDTVILCSDIPDTSLVKGMVGVVIDTYTSPFLAYEVEFCNKQGETLVSLALPENALQLYCP
ncbi:DUF4926 domain-containing protein [Chimaeribacter arupi]|uniref:DUF4926 domain-containing protein n=1 Tax=Chimaeribacter arupi TaxID=2060066 RepID=UPI000C7B2CD6|nr:DUF4926 domain-containing protein [Chimaeribacter arupi]PLR44596.1 DUF4926 domain-containing protein [Chimaeribacter arupi]